MELGAVRLPLPMESDSPEAGIGMKLAECLTPCNDTEPGRRIQQLLEQVFQHSEALQLLRSNASAIYSVFSLAAEIEPISISMAVLREVLQWELHQLLAAAPAAPEQHEAFAGRDALASYLQSLGFTLVVLAQQMQCADLVPEDCDAGSDVRRVRENISEFYDAGVAGAVFQKLSCVRMGLLCSYELLDYDIPVHKSVSSSAKSAALELISMLGSVEQEEKTYGAMLLEAELQEHKHSIELLVNMLELTVEARKPPSKQYSWLASAATMSDGSVFESTEAVRPPRKGTVWPVMGGIVAAPPPAQPPGELPYVSQRVLFASDHDYTAGRKEGYGFGTQQADQLRFGSADVTLPMDRKPGSDDANNVPWRVPADQRQWYHINLNFDDVHVEPQGTMTEDRTWFLDEVKGAVTRSKAQELVLYVHGFNTCFGDAVKTAAQLVVDTAGYVIEGPDAKFGPRAAIAFDWASCGSAKEYRADLVRARAAGPRLAELLSDLARMLRPGPQPVADAPKDDPTWCKGIHIVCHSMGNYVLQQALLHRLQSRQMLVDAAPEVFGNTKSVIFAAPDISRHDMVRMLTELQVSSKPPAGGRLLVLYCSKDDKPLWASSRLMWGADTSGRAGYFNAKHNIHPFMCNPDLLQTVDASGHFDDALAHGYFRTNKEVLADIGKVLARGERMNKTIRLRAQHEVHCEVCWTNILHGQQLFCIQ